MKHPSHSRARPDGPQLTRQLTRDTPAGSVPSAKRGLEHRDLPAKLRLMRNNKWLYVMQQKLTDTVGIQ